MAVPLFSRAYCNHFCSRLVKRHFRKKNCTSFFSASSEKLPTVLWTKNFSSSPFLALLTFRKSNNYVKYGGLQTRTFNRRKATDATASTVPKEHFPDVKDFDSAYDYIVEDLTQKDYNIPPYVAERLRQVLNYNVMGGKKIRGLTVVSAYTMLSRSSLELHKMKLAFILGWCVEMLQGFFLVSDDIMDNGSTRRGKPCWFRLPGVGLEALNDALLLESSIYQMLKYHFSEIKCYTKIVDTFLECTRNTIFGQCLDMGSNPSNQPPQLGKFTHTYYKHIVELKTAHYTFCLPVHLSMHLIGGFEAEHYEVSKAICMKLGYLFQMQDDYLDLYGHSDMTGKLGTDISQGKCTWFAVTALHMSSEADKCIMKEYYGVDDPVAVRKILELYSSHSIKEKYFAAEENLHTEITSLISVLDERVFSKQLFSSLLNRIYRREK